MRERLRIVADEPLSLDIVFLGEEPDVVAHRDEALEEPHRLVLPSRKHVGVDEPERACEEGCFSARNTVHVPPVHRRITRDEAVVHE